MRVAEAGRSRWVGAALVMGAWGMACSRVDAPGERAPAVTVELSGCVSLFADGRCAPPPDGRVQVLVAGARGVAEVRLAGGVVAAEATAVADGERLTVVLPAGARPASLQVTVAGRSVAGFSIVAAEPAAPTERGAIEAALAAADAAGRGPLLRALARVHLGANELEVAARRYREAEAADAAVGRVSGVAGALHMQAFIALNHQLRFAEARALLARHAAVAPDPLGRAHGVYLEGLLSWRTGDVLGAMRRYSAAEAAYARLGHDAGALGARRAFAVAMRAVGRGEEALALLAAVAAQMPATAACERAKVQNDIGWVQLLERLRRGYGPDPRPALAAAHAAFAEGACASRPSALNAALNLALAALEAGDGEASRRWLATLPTDQPALAAWRLEIEGRLALRSGETAEAMGRFEALAARADALSPEVAWSAAVGMGDVHWTMGAQAAALAAWRAAEALLDSEAMRLPLDGDRSFFVVDRARSARRLVAGLVAAGRADEALCAARLARARSLAAVARRDRIAALDVAARRRWEEAWSAWRQARSRAEAAAADEWKLAKVNREAARAARAAELAGLESRIGEVIGALERAGPRPGCADLRRPAAGELVLAWSWGELPEARPALYGWAASGDAVRAVVHPAGAGGAGDDGAWLLAPFDG
ncbi:MAG: hypothetical protein R3F65_16050, partial [bacterium]